MAVPTATVVRLYDPVPQLEVVPDRLLLTDLQAAHAGGLASAGAAWWSAVTAQSDAADVAVRSRRIAREHRHPDAADVIDGHVDSVVIVGGRSAHIDALGYILDVPRPPESPPFDCMTLPPWTRTNVDAALVTKLGV
jgi:hypothetical protein